MKPRTSALGRAPTYQVELLLKLFICIIDTKLFKAVDVERFKAEQKGQQPPSKTADSDMIVKPLKLPYLPINVQHSNESVLFSRNLQRSVYPGYDAVKQVGVDLLGEGISGVYRPLLGLRLHQRLSRQNDPAMAQPACQRLRLHGQQLTEDSQVRVTELEEKRVTGWSATVPPSRPTGAQTHRNGRLVASRISDFHIPQVQNGRQHFEDVRLKVLLQPCR